MGKLFLFMMVSLDGYFEGVNHDLSWHNVDAEFNDFAVKQLHAADTLIFGRKTYELMASYWPTEQGKDDPAVAKLMNDLPKVVCSRTLTTADWNNTRLVKDDVAAEIKRLKAQSGKELAILGSNNLCISLLNAGLLDEVRIMLSPVTIGAGTSLFYGLHEKLRLELLSSRRFDSGNVLLVYRPELIGSSI